MSKPVTTAIGALVAAALMGAGAAQAQPYGYYGAGSGGYSYDACRRAQTERGTAGALVGGGMGAVIGSNAAARNARTEGALLGGLLGAVIGGTVGNKSAACQPGYIPTADRPAPPPPPPLAPPPVAYEPPPPAYDTYRTAEPPRAADSGDCTLAESPIYMPDGRTQKRFVRVCRDASGRYAVVD